MASMGEAGSSPLRESQQNHAHAAQRRSGWVMSPTNPDEANGSGDSSTHNTSIQEPGPSARPMTGTDFLQIFEGILYLYIWLGEG